MARPERHPKVRPANVFVRKPHIDALLALTLQSLRRCALIFGTVLTALPFPADTAEGLTRLSLPWDRNPQP